jgi:hypothetical protein
MDGAIWDDLRIVQTIAPAMTHDYRCIGQAISLTPIFYAGPEGQT